MDFPSLVESVLHVGAKRVLGGALILLLAVILVVISQKN